MLLVYFVAAGLLLGVLLGGRLGRLGDVRFRWWPLALGGLAFQAVLFSEPVASAVGAAGPALYVASTLVVLAALLRDHRLPGFRIIAVGAGLNLLVIVANGGLMPASPEAFVALTGLPAVPSDVFTNSVVADGRTPFAFLGDNHVLPRPWPFANVFSIGDVIIGLGAVVFLVRVLRDGAPSRRMRPDAPPDPAAAAPYDGVRASTG